MHTSDVPPQIQQWLDQRQLTIAALASKSHQQKMHVYRVLRNQIQHKHVVTLLRLSRVFNLVNAEGKTDIDTLAHHALDFGEKHFQTWIRAEMIKNGIPSKRNLAIRAGLEEAQIFLITSSRYQYIQLRIYRNIARGLGVTLANLLDALLDGNPEHELLTPLLPPVTVTPVIVKRCIEIYPSLYIGGVWAIAA